MNDAASIWYPLFDTPITVRLSREQLAHVKDALLGVPEPVPGWNEYFAGELERVLDEKTDSETP